MTAKVKCEYISWSRFYALSRKLTYRVHDSGFNPDIIVAIGRGGYMPARIISDFLQVMNLTSFKMEHYLGTHKKHAVVVRYPLSQGVSGNRVLLVDDVCDTGDTFAVAGRHLEEHMQPAEIRSAVIHHKKTSRFIPDYYASRVVKWRWIIYPWAVAEDISEFIRQMQPYPENIAEMQAFLAREYGVRLPLQLLEDIRALSLA